MVAKTPNAYECSLYDTFFDRVLMIFDLEMYNFPKLTLSNFLTTFLLV